MKFRQLSRGGATAKKPSNAMNGVGASPGGANAGTGMKVIPSAPAQLNSEPARSPLLSVPGAAGGGGAKKGNLLGLVNMANAAKAQ